MKNIRSIVAILCCSTVYANDIEGTVQGGAYSHGHQDAFTDADHFKHKTQYTQDRDNLINSGKLSINRGGFQPQFIMPLRTTNNDPGFFGVSNYVDQDPVFNGNVEDFFCGARTYDLSNYNHKGIDFFTWPYAWDKMDNDEVEVVAAADGVITTKLDGNFDRNCDFSDPNWNAVYVTYNDGSYSYYGHLKNGSLTSKQEGASVVAGEYLGVVGSSGSSTGPHLHFETYDLDGNLIEPYSGQCNRMNNDSWWLDQEAYRESKVNKLASHDVEPDELSSCPTNIDMPNYQDDFDPGDTVYLAAYYRDQELNQLSSYYLLKPDGSEFGSAWHHNSPDTYNASYWYITRQLPNDAEPGAWTFRVNYNLNTYEHVFYVGDLIFESAFEN
ncbi:peptidoglycan DD-metalloendopeptidase family protein [Marinicella rhabdoformis]|uniref:peptidoglycan DD-metalloendopeptidase family protein n=1 Tax=Marinicella rhabdoformis TaxID=2580566 RepID=UPI0012AED34D|nr:peptidoglycan DD-metalloendopeptidase family protein [Marinicella rhabdoformis]